MIGRRKCCCGCCPDGTPDEITVDLTFSSAQLNWITSQSWSGIYILKIDKSFPYPLWSVSASKPGNLIVSNECKGVLDGGTYLVPTTLTLGLSVFCVPSGAQQAWDYSLSVSDAKVLINCYFGQVWYGTGVAYQGASGGIAPVPKKCQSLILPLTL